VIEIKKNMKEEMRGVDEMTPVGRIELGVTISAE